MTTLAWLRSGRWTIGHQAGLARRREVVGAIPDADAPEHADGDHGDDREPGDARLAVGHYDRRREQGADGRADIAADLEDRLGEAVTAARRQTSDAGRFRMEDRRADPDQPGRDQKHAVCRRDRQQDQAAEARAHPDGQRVGLRPLVGVDADERLQQRCRHLEGESDQPDLSVVEGERVLEDRVDRRQQRLDRVVEEVRDAERDQDREYRWVSDYVGLAAALRWCVHVVVLPSNESRRRTAAEADYAPERF